MPIEIESLKSKIKVILANKDQVSVVLFGSYAKGTATSESDVDLLVVAEQLQTARQAVRNLYKGLSTIALDYDILGYSKAQVNEKIKQSIFFQKILTEGITLYGNRL